MIHGKVIYNKRGIFQSLPLLLGLWYLNPSLESMDTTVWIEVRDTQWKAELSAGSTFHFNLCRYSSPVHSTSLGRQNLTVRIRFNVQTGREQ